MKKSSFPEFKNQESIWIPYLLLLLSIFLLAYTIIRSTKIELTIDEIFSYKYFSHDFHLYPDQYVETTSNDHWLNSWLMHITTALFGSSSFAIRLPTLLAHSVYLFFTTRFVLTLRKNWFAVAAFVLLNVNPYLLDFFTAARGYGLSFASIAACIFFLLRFASSNSRKDLIYTLIAATLALLANFAVISFFLVAIGLLLLLVLFESNNRKWTDFLWIFSIVTVILSIVIPHLLKMQKANALYYGQEELWKGTTGTLMKNLLYDAPYVGKDPFRSAIPTIYVAFAIIFTGIIVSLKKHGFKKWLFAPSGILILLFVGTIIEILVQHFITGAKYPVTRVGLFIFILWMFALIISLQELLNRKVLIAVSALLSLPVIFHFCYCANFGYLLEWKDAAGTQIAENDIIKWHDKNKMHAPVTVCTMGINGSTLFYLHERDTLSWMDVFINWSNDQPKYHDFYLIEKWAIPSYNTNSWIPIDTLPYSGNVLYRDSLLVK